jgi:hypothetical protein
MAELVDKFLGAINNIAQRSVDATPIDLTIDAVVRVVSNVETGQYKVEYQNNTFDAYSLNPEVVY